MEAVLDINQDSDSAVSSATEYVEGRSLKHSLLLCFPKRKKKRRKKTSKSKQKTSKSTSLATEPPSVEEHSSTSTSSESFTSFRLSNDHDMSSATSRHCCIDRTPNRSSNTSIAPSDRHNNKSHSSSLLITREECAAKETEDHPLQLTHPSMNESSSSQEELSSSYCAQSPTGTHFSFPFSSIENLNTGNNHHHEVTQHIRQEINQHYHYHHDCHCSGNRTDSAHDYLSGNQSRNSTQSSVEDILLDNKTKAQRRTENRMECKENYLDEDVPFEAHTLPLRGKSSKLVTNTLPCKAFMNSDSSFKESDEKIEMKLFKCRPRLCL